MNKNKPMRGSSHLNTLKEYDWNKNRQIPGGPYACRFIETLSKFYNTKRFLGIYAAAISTFCKRYSYRKVLLVGSNPSQKSPNNTAFHPDTKSRQFVDKWFKDEGWTVAYENLVDVKTDKNKQLSNSQIKNNLEWIVANMDAYNKLGYKIVACGEIASRGLTMAEVEHFKMPHPSGLCRFWNDKEAGEAKVKEMKEWVLKKKDS